MTAITFAHRAQIRRMFGAKIRARKVRLPKQRQPNTERLAYATALLAIVKYAMDLLRKHLIPELEALSKEATLIHDAKKTYADKVQSILDRSAEELFRHFPGERVRAIAQKMGERVSKTQRAELKRQLKAAFGEELGIDVLTERGIADRIETWASQNAKLVSRVPRGFYDEVGQRVVDSLRKGTRATDLAKEITERFGVAESRARLIARDQIGKLNGELNKARQKNLGVERFVWRTVEDERVREEHEELDGREFKWTDPPSEGIPGEPINCRCSAEPDLSDLIEAL